MAAMKRRMTESHIHSIPRIQCVFDGVNIMCVCIQGKGATWRTQEELPAS